MKKFGILNGCYWMLLDSLEDAIKYMDALYFKMNSEYIVTSLEAGKVIAINKASGFHAGGIENYTDVVYSVDYPVAPKEV